MQFDQENTTIGNFEGEKIMANKPSGSSSEHSVRPLNGVCTVGLTNNLPSDWNSVIVAATIQFRYAEGAPYNDSDTNLHVTTGQTATFRSNDAANCVVGVHMACSVQLPGQPGPVIAESDGTAPPGECASDWPFEISAKSSSTREFLIKGSNPNVHT
ncbi:hypothetical protein [Burkholderia sp. MSMB1498]|uniref:hypothetical protein n=1 Tax=Burkholderia sp. MSMB1498 TaxID=1637842 RepID=UPI0012E331EE|nr:hypothetical protein [Burkholderia sp. MSMB1498]